MNSMMNGMALIQIEKGHELYDMSEDDFNELMEEMEAAANCPAPVDNNNGKSENNNSPAWVPNADESDNSRFDKSEPAGPSNIELQQEFRNAVSNAKTFLEGRAYTNVRYMGWEDDENILIFHVDDFGTEYEIRWNRSTESYSGSRL